MWYWIFAIALILLAVTLIFGFVFTEVVENQNTFLVLTVIFVAAFVVAIFVLNRLIPKPGKADVSSIPRAIRISVPHSTTTR